MQNNIPIVVKEFPSIVQYRDYTRYILVVQYIPHLSVRGAAIAMAFPIFDSRGRYTINSHGVYAKSIFRALYIVAVSVMSSVGLLVNSLCAGSVICDTNQVITVPADGLASNGARSSAVTALITKLNTKVVHCLLSQTTFFFFKMAD